WSDGQSFRSQDGTLGETRATCCADPFSHCFVSCGGSLRLDRALDQAARPCRRGIFQFARGRDFDAPGSCHWPARVALPTRGAEGEGSPFIAPPVSKFLSGWVLAESVRASTAAPSMMVSLMISLLGARLRRREVFCEGE